MLGPRAVARRVSSPIRGYLNAHFEAVKDEIRDTAQRYDQRLAAGVDVRNTEMSEQTWAHIHQLNNNLQEAFVHQARLLRQANDRIETQNERLTELEALVESLAGVIGDVLSQPDIKP